MDAESCLIHDLEVSLRSFRLSAIEEAIRSGGSERLLAALQARLPAETDEECLILLNHAIASVQQKVRGAEAEALTAEQFLTQFPRAEAQERLRLLESLSPLILQAIGPKAPDLLMEEKHPLVQSSIIRTFSRSWPKDSLKALLPSLASNHFSTRWATLETFIQRAPEFLQRELPRLLMHKEPRLRTLAIRGLAKIDFEESLTHLQALFESEARENKVAAVADCVFFPFDRVKPLLLKLVSLESDIDLIERAGLVLLNNPDPEVPFRLYEIAETAAPDKRKAVQNLVRQTSSLIEKTGILGERLKAYQEYLQTWITHKAINRWVQEVVQKLAETDEITPDLEAAIIKKLEQPLFRDGFTQALEWPIKEEVKQRLKGYLDGRTVPIPTPISKPTHAPKGTSTPVEKSRPPSFEEFSLDEKLRFILGLKAEDLASSLDLLKGVLNDPKAPLSLLAPVIKTAARLNCPEFIAIAKKYAKDDEGNLAAAAIEYLGVFDSDWVFVFMGKFLQSENLRVKSAAIRVLLRNDVKTSLTTLKAMLGHKNDEQHKMALSCMVYFEFSLVRPILFEFLQGKRDADLIKSGLCFFKANPEPENLFCLFQLERAYSGELATLAKKLRGENEEFLVKAGLLDAADSKKREDDFSRRYQEIQEKLKLPLSSYSLQKLNQVTQIQTVGDLFSYLRAGIAGKSLGEVMEMLAQAIQNWDDTRDLLKKVFTGFFRKFALPVGLLFLAGLVFLMVTEDSGGDAKGPQKEGSILAIPVTVVGKVEQVKENELYLKAGDGKSYIVEKMSGNYPAIPPGTEVKVVLHPYRLTPEGTTLAHLQSIDRPDKK